MTTWQDIKHYAGFDWAKNSHCVMIINAQGELVCAFSFPHTAEGWQDFRTKIQPYLPLAIAIETSQGLAVEQLLDTAQCIVYPINPRSAKAYRDRKTPSANKTDPADARAFANALRMDGHGWKALLPTDPLVSELKMLCRDETELIHQRTSWINKLQQAVCEYYPIAIEAFDDWSLPSTWAFIECFPTPAKLTQAGQRQWHKFMHAHKLYRPQLVEQRIKLFAKAESFCGSQPTIKAKSLLALTSVRILKNLQEQLDEYRKRIEELFEQHPDHDIFGSLPGAGGKLAPRLLSEILGSHAQDRQHLQCIAGTAPISYQSGQINVSLTRWRCNKSLRCALHLWTDLSRRQCNWAQKYYEGHRAKGHGHAHALRCLAQRWLKIIWKMLEDHTSYNPEIHHKNQLKHGSWVVQNA